MNTKIKQKAKYIQPDELIQGFKAPKSIILKDRTGSGLTTALLSKTFTEAVYKATGKKLLVITPYTSQVVGKHRASLQNDSYADVQYCASGLTSISNYNPEKHLMTTYASFQILSQNQMLFNKLRSTHILCVDEYHTLSYAYEFMNSNVKHVITEVQAFENAYLFSATEEKHGDFFQNLPTYQLDSGVKPIEVKLVRNPINKAKIAQHIAKIAETEHVLLFSNDSKFLTELSNEIDVICGANGAYRAKALVYSDKQDQGYNAFDYNYNIHLSTASGFEGIDFLKDAHVFVYSQWINLGNVVNNVVDSSLKQCIGRVRGKMLSATLFHKISDKGVCDLYSHTSEQIASMRPHERRAVCGAKEIFAGKSFDGGLFTEPTPNEQIFWSNRAKKLLSTNKNINVHERCKSYLTDKAILAHAIHASDFLNPEQAEAIPANEILIILSCHMARRFGFEKELLQIADNTKQARDVVRFVYWKMYPIFSQYSLLKIPQEIPQKIPLLDPVCNVELCFDDCLDNQFVACGSFCPLNAQAYIGDNTFSGQKVKALKPYNLDQQSTLFNTTFKSDISLCLKRERSNFDTEQVNYSLAINFLSLFEYAYTASGKVPELNNNSSILKAEQREQHNSYSIVKNGKDCHVVAEDGASLVIETEALNYKIRRAKKADAEKIVKKLINEKIKFSLKKMHGAIFLALNGITPLSKVKEFREYNGFALSSSRMRKATILNFSQFDIDKEAPTAVCNMLESHLGTESTFRGKLSTLYGQGEGKARKQAKRAVNTVMNMHGESLTNESLLSIGMNEAEAKLFKGLFNERGSFFRYYTEREMLIMNAVRNSVNQPTIRVHDAIFILGDVDTDAMYAQTSEGAYKLSLEQAM